MKAVLLILTITCLVLIAYQDMKSQAVSWIIFPVLVIAILGSSLRVISLKEFLIHTLSNLAVIATQIVLLLAYFSFKKKKFVSIINSKIGLGDLLFFVALCMAFSILNFIFFLLASLIFSLILGFLLTKKSDTQAKIPLAGYMSIAYTIFIVVQLVTDFDPYGNQLMNSLIYQAY